MDERNFKNTEIFKNVEFYNVEFENGRGFLKMAGVFENGRCF